MIISFTGPSKLTMKQELSVAKILDEIADQSSDADGATWRSGCARGVDTMVAHHAGIALIDLELYIPAAPHNGKLTSEMWNYASKVYRCPFGYEPYRIRNIMMVEGADKLVAFVKSPRFYRSGEWMTINIARKFKVPVEIKEI
jgi:hypothetical protein